MQWLYLRYICVRWYWVKSYRDQPYMPRHHRQHWWSLFESIGNSSKPWVRDMLKTLGKKYFQLSENELCVVWEALVATKMDEEPTTTNWFQSFQGKRKHMSPSTSSSSLLLSTSSSSSSLLLSLLSSSNLQKQFFKFNLVLIRSSFIQLDARNAISIKKKNMPVLITEWAKHLVSFWTQSNHLSQSSFKHTNFLIWDEELPQQEFYPKSKLLSSKETMRTSICQFSNLKRTNFDFASNELGLKNKITVATSFNCPV